MEKFRKILQISPYYPPDYDFGGPVRLVSELSELLAKNFDTTVYTYSFGEPKDFKDSDDFVVKRFSPFNRSISKRFNLFYSNDFNKTLEKEIKNFSLVHTHDLRSFHNIKLAELCRKNNIPLVISTYKSINPNTGRSYFKKPFDFFYSNKIISSADHFIAVNEMEKQDILKFNVPEEKISIIPNSIKTIDTSSPPNFFRNKFNIGPNKKILLFFSRIHKYKRPDIILNAFPEILKNNPEAILVFYGPDGGELKNLEKLKKSLNLNKEILLIPHAAGKEKNAAYNESDLLVLPSPHNEFPLVLLEAMAHGLPIITSEQSLKKYIDYKCGRVIPCSSESYSQTICELLNNSTECQKYRQNSKKIFIDNFTLDKYLKILTGIYNQL